MKLYISTHLHVRNLNRFEINTYPLVLKSIWNCASLYIFMDPPLTLFLFPLSLFIQCRDTMTHILQGHNGYTIDTFLSRPPNICIQQGEYLSKKVCSIHTTTLSIIIISFNDHFITHWICNLYQFSYLYVDDFFLKLVFDRWAVKFHILIFTVMFWVLFSVWRILVFIWNVCVILTLTSIFHTALDFGFVTQQSPLQNA